VQQSEKSSGSAKNMSRLEMPAKKRLPVRQSLPTGGKSVQEPQLQLSQAAAVPAGVAAQS